MATVPLTQYFRASCTIQSISNVRPTYFLVVPIIITIIIIIIIIDFPYNYLHYARRTKIKEPIILRNHTNLIIFIS